MAPNCTFVILFSSGKSKERTFQCGVFSPKDKFTPLKANPGEMIWKLGSKVLSRSDKYEKVGTLQLSYVSLQFQL